MRHKIKVTIRGVEYPSHAAAARALGVSQIAVSAAYKRGTLDNVGLGSNRTPKITKILGKEYVSQSVAARDLGVTEAQLSAAIFVMDKLKIKYKN